MPFSLAHISDIHLGPLPDVRLRELLSKRATGYANWKRHRGKTMGVEALTALVNTLHTAKPDHIAVTGDLMNIALPTEIENTGLWLEALGDPHDVSLVPGNHDAYIRGILSRALQRWAPYLTDDDGRAMASNDDFPYMRVRGPLAIIGLNSAVATAPFVAAGSVSNSQCKRLATLLEDAKKRGLFRVLMIHHPPVYGAASPQKRLFGISRVQATLMKAGAELVLHGHTHLPQRHTLTAEDGSTIHIVGVPSASEGFDAKRPASSYNWIEIDGNATDGWQCNVTMHTLVKSTGTHMAAPVEQLQF